MTEIDRRLDELAKSLADRGHTRRGVLKLGAGALGVMAAALLPGRLRAAPGEPGGNSACAHFCPDVFQGPDAGHCTSDAAHGTGPCVRCAADVTRICGKVTTPDQLVCCVPKEETCCVDPTTGQGTCCKRGTTCCRKTGKCFSCPPGQVPNQDTCTCGCPDAQVPCGEKCCPPGTRCCLSPTGAVACCTDNQFCCVTQGICHDPCPIGKFPNPDTCTCECPPGAGLQDCGPTGTCCPPAAQGFTCCTLPDGTPTCCPPGTTCSPNGCVPRGCGQTCDPCSTESCAPGQPDCTCHPLADPAGGVCICSRLTAQQCPPGAPPCPPNQVCVMSCTEGPLCAVPC